ncbi:MAG: hypothetical protein Q7U57_13045 [Methylovulum sp.]|nr:hypothetical protein [Methylovulum sp.]
MLNQNSDAQHSNIIESINQAFGTGSFYGLEYVLDELAREQPLPLKQNTVDWFGATDFFA